MINNYGLVNVVRTKVAKNFVDLVAGTEGAWFTMSDEHHEHHPEYAPNAAKYGVDERAFMRMGCAWLTLTVKVWRHAWEPANTVHYSVESLDREHDVAFYRTCRRDGVVADGDERADKRRTPGSVAAEIAAHMVSATADAEWSNGRLDERAE